MTLPKVAMASVQLGKSPDQLAAAFQSPEPFFAQGVATQLKLMIRSSRSVRGWSLPPLLGFAARLSMKPK